MMAEHYHVLPITPNPVLESLGDHTSFMISHATSAKSQYRLVEPIAERIAYDCGAFTYWMRILAEFDARAGTDNPMSQDELEERLHADRDWTPYYDWLADKLHRPTSWAIVPDKIDAASQEQGALIKQWPYPKSRSAPVWHLHHPISRLIRLLHEGWNRVCIGSAGEFRVIGTPQWFARMNEVFTAVHAEFGDYPPPIHLLRMMQFLAPKYSFPAFSADSSNLGQNHHRAENDPPVMALRIARKQPQPRFIPSAVYHDLFGDAA